MFLLSKNIFLGSKYPKINKINFEKKITADGMRHVNFLRVVNDGLSKMNFLRDVLPRIAQWKQVQTGKVRLEMSRNTLVETSENNTEEPIA